MQTATRLTICPPAPQTVHFDLHQFFCPHHVPVHAVKTAEGWDTTGISFEDYARMGVRSHKPCNERRLPTPNWALNDSKLRSLLVRFFENRAGITLAIPGAEK